MATKFFNTYGGTLGHRVRLLRQDRGWKQTELAEEMEKRGQKISNAWISEIEKSDNDKMPSLDTLCALADALNTTTDFLLLRTDGPTRAGDVMNHHWSEEADAAGKIIDALLPDWRAHALNAVEQVRNEYENLRRQEQEILAWLDKVEAAAGSGGGAARAIAEQFARSRLQQLRSGSRRSGVPDEVGAKN